MEKIVTMLLRNGMTSSQVGGGEGDRRKGERGEGGKRRGAVSAGRGLDKKGRVRREKRGLHVWSMWREHQ